MALLLALCLMGESLDMDELSAQLHLDTGYALMQQGLFEQAEAEFNVALEYQEDCHAALLGLGMIYRACSSWDRAEEHFWEFISRSPDDYRGYFELASLYMDTGRPDSALIMADSAFLRAPMNPEIWMLNGRSGLAVGDTLVAERWFARCTHSAGNVGLEATIYLADIYRLTQRGADAREILLPVAASGYSPALWSLSRVYLDWGDYMRAVDAIENYLMLSPDGPYADSAYLVLESLAESGEYIAPD